MRPITVIEGVAVPLAMPDIDTDQILPARFMHEPRVDYGRYCFHDLRFDARSGARLDGFILNRPPFDQATVIVGGPNFGCGSSREQAVHTIADYGVRALICASFGDIFAINCLKNGLLPVRVEERLADDLIGRIEAHPGLKVRIDLPEQTVSTSDGWFSRFEIDGFYKEALLAGLDEIDITLKMVDEIASYEAKHDRALMHAPSADGTAENRRKP